MLPVIVKPPVTRRQKRAAIAIAGIVDLLEIGLLPLFPALGLGYALDDVLDVIAAILLTAICGFKWQFVVAFGMELLPFFDLLPTWTAVALLLPVEKQPGAAGLIEDAQRVRATPAQPQEPAATGSHEQVIDVEAVVVPPIRGSGSPPENP